MSTSSPLINLTRDIEAIQIPSGLTKKLEKGTPCIITQALGEPTLWWSSTPQVFSGCSLRMPTPWGNHPCPLRRPTVLPPRRRPAQRRGHLDAA